MSEKTNRTVIKAKINYPALSQPKSINGSAAKYSGCFIIAKDDIESLNKYQEALEAAYPGENYPVRLQRGFRAISLNGHPALASAYTNDVDPLMTYAQQLYIFGQKGDAVLGITTSGNAKNILNLFKVARVLGISTYLLTGNNEQGVCRPYADFILDVPAREAYLVQEYHLPIYHALAMMLEERFYGSGQ